MVILYQDDHIMVVILSVCSWLAVRAGRSGRATKRKATRIQRDDSWRGTSIKVRYGHQRRDCSGGATKAAERGVKRQFQLLFCAVGGPRLGHPSPVEGLVIPTRFAIVRPPLKTGKRLQTAKPAHLNMKWWSVRRMTARRRRYKPTRQCS